MNTDILNAWAAGLFEGEGSFQISKGRSAGLVLTSTDKDVIDRLKDNYGGTICFQKKRKEHWKDTYIWTIKGKEAINFYNYIKPFLLSRRKKRGEEWFQGRSIIKDYSKIIPLFNDGKTHKEIAIIMNMERSCVTHYLNRRGIKKNAPIA